MPQIQHNGQGFDYILEIQRKGSADKIIVNPTDWRLFEYFYPAQGQVYEPYQIRIRARNAEGFAHQDPSWIRGFSGEDRKFRLVYFLSDSLIIIS